MRLRLTQEKAARHNRAAAWTLIRRTGGISRMELADRCEEEWLLAAAAPILSRIFLDAISMPAPGMTEFPRAQPEREKGDRVKPVVQGRA